MMKRKARSDRNHAIYQITNIVTGERYIGVIVAAGNVKKALKVRIQKHIRRALTENKGWALCQNIRNYGVESFEYGLFEIVRGKADAHARERELTAILQPELNTL